MTDHLNRPIRRYSNDSMSPELTDEVAGPLPVVSQTPLTSTEKVPAPRFSREIVNSKTSVSRSTEWIPLMLRHPALAAVAVVCCGAIAALEALRYVTQSRAIPPDNVNILNLARYMPTVGVILIAFAFRAMATDVKKLTPWSNMSGRWATGSRSLLLDYINEMEILAVFRAAGRKDWAIVVGLTATFLCGLLVPFANSLVYVDLTAAHIIPTTLTHTSVFDFGSDPLVLPAGNLTLPRNYTGEKPYAHVASERESGGKPPPWTIFKYAFDRFSLSPDSPSAGNGTMMAQVNAISVNIDCDQAEYSLGGNYRAEIESCPLPIEQDSRAVHTTSWINVTQCSTNKNDLRMTATVLWVDPDSGLSTVSGVACSPSFTQQTATVRVNISSNELVNFDLVGEPQPLDIHTPLEALWLYLINPLDTQTLKSYGRGTAQANGHFGPYDASQIPVATTTAIIDLVHDLTIYGYSTDTFTTLLPAGAIGNLTKLDQFQAEVELLATQIWVQVISLLARKPVEQSLAGEVIVIQRRILVWEYGLRVIQALLALLAIVCITFGMGLRPSTALAEDPGSLATASLILADSDTAVERKLGQNATTSQDRMASEIRDAQFLFEGRAVRGQLIDLDNAPAPEHEPSQPEDGVKSPPPLYQPVPGDDEGKGRAEVEGWRPMALLMGSKIALIVSIVAVMVALALLLWTSYRLDGIAKVTTDSTAAFPLVTSTILVLLGYGCAGVDGATQVLAPFNVMRRRPNPYGIFIDFQSALGRLSELGSIRVNVALVASSAIMLIIPVLKIVAAGLFETAMAQRTMPVDLTLDQSLMMNLESTFGLGDSDATVRKACQYAEWETDPTFEFPTRSGIIDNLVFSNITEVVSNQSNKTLPLDGTIEARVPAILVDIHCVPVPSQNFKLKVSYQSDQGWFYNWSCATVLCRNAFNHSGLQEHGFVNGHSTQIYQGEAGFRGYVYDMAGPPAMMDYDYILYLGDYESVSHPFKNLTYVGESSVLATPGTLNVSLPTMQGTVCYRNLSRVTVDTTFTRPSKADIEGPEILLPWRPVSYDVDSIVHEGSYPSMQPKWFAPPILQVDQYAGLGSYDGLLQSDTLWPSRGSSNNFFELLAVYAQFQRQNLSSLLDADVFAQSAQHMYTLYVTQLLTELRSSALSSSAASLNGTRQLQAKLSYAESRLVQQSTATYVLEALLAVTVVFLVWIFRQFPSKAILPKPPSSIAAQFSLLAESTLVRQIREQNVDQQAELKRWRAMAALGWWPTSASGEETNGWRWGVDIGAGVQLHNWRVAPETSSMTSAPSRSVSPLTSLDLESAAVGSGEPSRSRRSTDLTSED